MAHTPRPAEAGVTIGQVFLGKYRIDSILGHGGMGVVALCTHLALNEKVAIKMLRQDVLGDRDAVERFMREAQAAIKLKSEYVARVLDVGVFENDVPFMVMEFLEGHDLGDLIEQRGTIPATWACDLMLQAAEALAEAHSISIIHRDVKPTNLFVTWRPDGTALIKVLDFGISKAPMGTDLQLTQTQSVLGTPAYMSPEQMRSARLVDARSDIWGLGSVMYELLEGHRPFDAESFSEMCVKVAVDPPAAMTKTPPALQAIVMRCLAKSPDDRFASMADFARELVPFSADPHHASTMVERMERMLRRAPMEWDSRPSSAAISARLVPATYGVTAPVQALPFAREPSVPIVMTDAFAAPRRISTLAIVLAVLGVLGAAALTFALIHSSGAAKPKHAAPPALAVKPAPADAAARVEPVEPIAPDASELGSAALEPVVQPPAELPKRPTATKAKPASKPIKDDPATPKADEPCNPYLHPHGCPH